MRAGYTISALAAASHSSLHDAALAMAAVLGNIAGPGAGIEGPAGDLINPGLNLVVAGRDHPSWNRLQELVLFPVVECQRMIHEASKSVNPTSLDHLQFGHLGDRTGEILKKSVFEVGAAQREFAVMRTPTFMLRSPDAETMKQALPEVMDTTSFLTYGDELFDRKNLLPQLTDYVCGCDRGAVRDPRVLGSTNTVQAHLLVTTTRDRLRTVVSDSGFQRLLHACWFLEPESAAMTVDPQHVRFGYRNLYGRVKEVLDARRTGAGLQLGLKPEAAAVLHEFCQELQSQSVPAALRPYFSDILALPYRLHWAFVTTLATQGAQESTDWILPFTMATTRQVLAGQKALLETVIADSQLAEHHRARSSMLWKLSEKPLVMRDLMRRYTIQKRELHEPVLEELISEGLVTRGPEGLLELSARGRGALAA